jgi:leucine dehydrogenase
MFKTKCDIFAPNAVGAILNNKTIPILNCKYICGASNNQLANPIVHDKMVAERGITYCPDFLVNRMGIVNCADESYGYVNEDPFKMRHFSKEFPYSIHNTI